jgi:phosphoribosylaminoimidazole-succinocarboxamide synthase
MDLFSLDLPGVPKIASGKVREIFDLGEHLLLVATDRISAFDCILPNPIPHKGAVLTAISDFWFRRLGFIENHVITTDLANFPPILQPYADRLAHRAMIVRKASPLPIECVVRGYLAGSGWKEYQTSRSVCGITLPAGLPQAAQLPEPIFTPATKAASGHDENISWERCVSILGEERARLVRDLTLRIYNECRTYAAGRGIIIADTKLEFGVFNDRVLLIDEVLTPDSSRFWPAEQYRPGISPPSYDKQFVRDYLETLDWGKTAPAPALPGEVIRKTSEKYIEAHARLTGRALADR